jgi:hypothetical protein
MEDWGEIILECIDTDDFWHLFDELVNDNSIFLNNRTKLLEAFKNGKLYGLRVNESDQMYERGAIIVYIFCKNSWYLLHCLCVKESNKSIIIWTHRLA